MTDGRGVDCVLDMVGTEAKMAGALDAVASADASSSWATRRTRSRCAGKRLAQNEIEVIGSRAGSPKELAEALALTTRASVRSIVTDRAPLDAV